MDKNKDGKVTRAEFVDMMGKMYDMKAKSMGVKGGGLDASQLEAMRLWMYSQ
jgi:EF hand